MKAIMLFLAAASAFSITSTAQTVSDYDGNVYPTVSIGTQVWMKQNLRTTHYNTGVSVPNITDSLAWGGLNTGARCYYNNDSATNNPVYGALYNWYVVQGSANICPVGWHVPSDAEWTIIENYLGGPTVAGGPMKEQGLTHWLTPNADATNSSGFTGLPGGFRGLTSAYQFLHENGFWWTSTTTPNGGSMSRYLWYMYGGVDPNAVPRHLGMSIRCVKNTTSATGQNGEAPLFKAYPNPMQHTLTIQLQKAGAGDITIWSLQGVVLIKQSFSGTLVELDTDNLAAGAYLLQVRVEQGSGWQKLVKH